MDSVSIKVKTWDTNTLKTFSINDGKIKVVDIVLENGQIDKLIQKVEKHFSNNKEFLIGFYETISTCSKEIGNSKLFLKTRGRFYLNKCYEKVEQLDKLTDTIEIKDELALLSKAFVETRIDEYGVPHRRILDHSSLMRQSASLYWTLLESLIETSVSPDQFYPEIIQLLIDQSAGAQKLIHNKSKKNALHYALLCNNSSIIKKMDTALKGSLGQWINSGSPSLLQMAIQNEQWEFAETLIKYGADINYQDKNTLKTALIRCIESNSGDVTSQIVFCLKQGANPGLQDIFWASALHYAAEKGNAEGIKLLIQDERAKSQIKERDIYGRNVIDIAHEENNEASLLVLDIDLKIEHGVKKRVKINQAIILDKFTKYLKLKQTLQQKTLEEERHNLSEGEYDKRKEEIIDLNLCQINIEKGGCCKGFSFLALYYNVRGLKAEFYRCLELISGWDEQELSLQTILDKENLTGNYANLAHLFEQWINDVAGFQEIGEHEHTHYATVKKLKDSEFKCFLKFDTDLTIQEFRGLLFVFAHLPHLLISIGGNEHATAIHVEEQKQMHYYDSNLRYQTPLFTPEESANGVINTHFHWTSEEDVPMLNIRSKRQSENLLNIDLSCYGFFEMQMPSTKAPGKVPEEIENLSTCQHLGWTPLHLAVIFNDQELLEKEMNNQVFNSLNRKDRFGNTPLMLALSWQRHAFIPLIINNPHLQLSYSPQLSELASENGYDLLAWLKK